MGKQSLKGYKKLSYSYTPLTYHFSLSHTYPYYVKWNYATFYGLCGATTYPYLPYEIIDPLDPLGLPQGVPRFQLQYIKLTFFPPHRF